MAKISFLKYSKKWKLLNKSSYIPPFPNIYSTVTLSTNQLTCCVRCWKPCQQLPGTCWRGLFPSLMTSSTRRDPHRPHPWTSWPGECSSQPTLPKRLLLLVFSQRSIPSYRWAESRGDVSCPKSDELKYKNDTIDKWVLLMSKFVDTNLGSLRSHLLR